VNRRFVLVALVSGLGLSGLSALAQEGTAEANHWRFGGGGRVHVRVPGGVSVQYSRPAYYSYYRPRSWSVGGSIYVGNGYYPRYRYYRPYYYYYYQPVPSYYGYENNYYPVQPPANASPGVVQVAPAARPELPRFGIGLFAGGVAVEDSKESSDLGVLARFRLTPGLLIEGELGKQSYQNDLRVDRRLGASLVYEIGAYNKLAPYILAGLGVQQADVNGDFTTTQNFGEIGIGLRLALSPHFHILADIRAGSRNTVSEDGATPPMDSTARVIGPPSSSSGESEEYTRARLSAVLYF
jgi:hypothetical protein